jgi:two-component system, chemotaxis family, CheB/CheR fusion protein
LFWRIVEWTGPEAFDNGAGIMGELRPDRATSLSESDESDGLPFVVVGVGASAGGLEAYTELLDGLSSAPGLALLLVSHLDPEQKSHLAPILSRTSRMPVIEVTEGMAVEVDRVYVMPPGTNMAMTDGHLTLSPRAPRPMPHMPIDHLFRSLATIQRDRSVGVILSGNGSDGVIALQAIKAAGGVTFAQNERTARFPSMPRAAVLDGNVDHVMAPREIAQELERISLHPYTKQADGRLAVSAEPGEDPIAAIINLLRLRMGVDFTHYKQTTIRRRVLRRMALRNLKDPGQYLALLRSDDAELQNLYQDFLIRVTQFFRDPDAFESLKEAVFPVMINGRPSGSVVRIWVAGCSTGEEVYSLAISLLEYLEGRTEKVVIKVLATDLNEMALEKARSGNYLDNIEIDVTPERLRKFFVRQDGHYQISKSIREMCIFSRHNIIHDAPFTRLDLVSCRNLLIYMDIPLQRRVIPLLHYALNPRGFLFLGTSENISGFSELFESVDSRNRIFMRSAVAAVLPMDFGTTIPTAGLMQSTASDERIPLWNALDVQKEADRVLLSRFTPVGVVVDETMTVLQFRGRTASYLEPAPGMASLDLFRMLREGLLAEVRAAALRAKAENVTVACDQLRMNEGGVVRTVRVEVIPFKVPPSGIRFFLVLFQGPLDARSEPARAVPTPQPVPTDEQVTQLQLELGALREYLQSVIEQQESTNEELKSANEEILSANEELQSTNEELQTAKEEAQSANEELATVNDELRHRNFELARVNDDLVNVLSGVNIPIVMVNRELRIRRATPMAEKLFHLIPSDIGRPISDLKSALEMTDLAERITSVIDSLTPWDSEVKDLAGRWYSLRIRPYVTLENKIDGASIVLIDIDSVRRQAAPHAEPKKGDHGRPSTH